MRTPGTRGGAVVVRPRAASRRCRPASRCAASEHSAQASDPRGTGAPGHCIRLRRTLWIGFACASVRAMLIDLMTLSRAAGCAVEETRRRAVADRRPKRLEFGDLQIGGRACSSPRRSSKKAARDRAAIVDAVARRHAAVAKAEIAGPGFVNISFDDAWLAEHAARRSRLRAVGQGAARRSSTTRSPNVAKPMHIGHIRSTIIGDAIKRALRAVGYEVVADNHLGDWGTQFGKLIVAYRRWVDQEAFAEDPVAELLRLYIKFQDESETKDEEDTKARSPLVAGGARRAGQAAAGRSREPRAVEEVRRRLDDRVRARLRAARRQLRRDARRELLQRPPRRHGEAARRQAASPRRARARSSSSSRSPTAATRCRRAIVRKADGGFNYATTDVAGTLYRVERWNPARIIILTDERQQLHFRQLFAIARRLGVTCTPRARLVRPDAPAGRHDLDARGQAHPPRGAARRGGEARASTSRPRRAPSCPKRSGARSRASSASARSSTTTCRRIGRRW